MDQGLLRWKILGTEEPLLSSCCWWDRGYLWSTDHRELVLCGYQFWAWLSWTHTRSVCWSAVLVLMHFWLFRDEATSLDRGVVSNGKTALFVVTIGSAMVWQLRNKWCESKSSLSSSCSLDSKAAGKPLHQCYGSISMEVGLRAAEGGRREEINPVQLSCRKGLEERMQRSGGMGSPAQRRDEIWGIPWERHGVMQQLCGHAWAGTALCLKVCKTTSRITTENVKPCK